MTDPIVHPDFNPYRKQNAAARDVRGYAEALAQLIDEYGPLIKGASTEEEKQSARDTLHAAIEKLKVTYCMGDDPDLRNLY